MEVAVRNITKHGTGKVEEEKEKYFPTWGVVTSCVGCVNVHRS